MKHTIYLILILSTTLLTLSFNLNKDKSDQKTIIGKFYIYSGTDNAEFIFDSLNCFKYYHWCDICPLSEIYGKWNRVDSLLILTDTLTLTIDTKKGDTLINKKNKLDTLYIREINNEILLCPEISKKFLDKLDNNERWKFGCYQKE